jgi:GTPase Era involved in 16S rRNA processing
MNQFRDLPIDRDVFIIASGESRNDITKFQYELLKEKYFVIALNFVDNIVPHARMWSDPNVTDYMDDLEKNCIYISRPSAFHTRNTMDLFKEVDYWFNDKEEKFNTNYKWTLFWLIQLLKKYFSDKKVYIIGMDCSDNISTRFIDGELKKEPWKRNNCEEMPVAFQTEINNDPKYFDNIYNCSFFSAVKCLKYADVQELIDG